MADDCLYITDKPLDKLYELYLQQHNPNVIISSNYALADGWDRFFTGDKNSPRLALCGLIPARLWSQLGGVDKKFIALCWAEDIAMNVLSIGGEVIMSDVFMDEEVEKDGKPRSRGSTLMGDHKSTDRALLESLWVSNGKPHFNRALPVEPFSDVDILVKSQDPQGRWRYESDLINRFMTTRMFFALKTWSRVLVGRIRRFRIRKIPYYLHKIMSGR